MKERGYTVEFSKKFYKLLKAVAKYEEKTVVTFCVQHLEPIIEKKAKKYNLNINDEKIIENKNS